MRRPPPVVYLVRPGDDNEELRYSLRSLVNLPHDGVILVGHHPRWVKNVTHVPGNGGGSKWLNVFDNLRRAARAADRFTVMNDDIFCLQPLSGAPSWYRCTLGEHIDRVKISPWRQSLERTLVELRKRGIPDPLSYEVHTPVVMEGRLLYEVLDPYKVRCANPPQWRTLYGNLHGVEAVRMPDTKVMRHDSPWDPGQPILSTDDKTWLTHPGAECVRQRFAEPCRYERA